MSKRADTTNLRGEVDMLVAANGVSILTDYACRVVLPLCGEVDRLRSEVAQLDAICKHLRQMYQPPMDEETGLWIGGLLCEHPCVTGERCDACGSKGVY